MLFVIDRKDAEVSDLCPEIDGEWYHLQDEIDYFNTIINWSDMWDLHEARRRLDNGWKLYLFKPDETIKGWMWLNTNTKEVCNGYVNPLYRNKGIGVELLNSAHRGCLDWKKWWCQSEDWNKPAHQLIINCNYKMIL